MAKDKKQVKEETGEAMKEDAKNANQEIDKARVQKTVNGRMQAICDTLKNLGFKAELIEDDKIVKPSTQERTDSVQTQSENLVRVGRESR